MSVIDIVNEVEYVTANIKHDSTKKDTVTPESHYF